MSAGRRHLERRTVSFARHEPSPPLVEMAPVCSPTAPHRARADALDYSIGLSASAEMVEDVSAQETQHPLAQLRQREGVVLCAFGDYPRRGAEQAAPLDHLGDERIPLDQRLLGFCRHEACN